MSNRLNNQISPYLLQHADNPVHWQPWDEEALALAREQNKPIFLSIGYAACHWCHVMERESFQNEDVAQLLNESFISIKVDREERPDLDNIYMNAVVALNRQGGWPLNVFLTPEGKPFYGGTYFPPVPLHGLPSFLEIITQIRRLWQEKQEALDDLAERIIAHLSTSTNENHSATTPQLHEILSGATRQLIDRYDRTNGGWGAAPKFPQPMLIEFLLLRASRGESQALELARHALIKMSQGGMYDLVGGGFHRYSTDNNWLVPHFEKMLYDNAQLARVYLHAYLITQNVSFREICTKTLDFIANELMNAPGGFCSSLDADSEGQEGKYYLWSYNEVKTLPDEIFDLMAKHLDISPLGNFEGKIIPRHKMPMSEQAASVSQPQKEKIQQGFNLLYQARQERVRPALDDKVILSWNALTLQAFAEAGFYLNDSRYLKIAQQNAHFLRSELMKNDIVYRTWRNGIVGSPAYLEDYASFILALLSLHQADWNVDWLILAQKLTNQMIDLFRDNTGKFYDTSNLHRHLVYRPHDLFDNATPSGSSLAAFALIKMSQVHNHTEWAKLAEQVLDQAVLQIHHYPSASGHWLQALDFLHGPVNQIVIISNQVVNQPNPFYSVLQKHFTPRSITLVADIKNQTVMSDHLDIFKERKLLQDTTTAYICEDFSCQLPVSKPSAFTKMISEIQNKQSSPR